MNLDNELRNWADEVDYNIKFTAEMSESCWSKIADSMKEDRKWYEEFFIVINRMNRRFHFKIVIPVAVIAVAIIIWPKAANTVTNLFNKTTGNQSISAGKEVRKEKPDEENPVKEKPVNEPPVQKDPEKKELVIKNSIDNQDYGNGGSVDIQLPGNSEKYTLIVTKEEQKGQHESENEPKKINLEIKGQRISFDNNFNEGIIVAVADFDKADRDVDIYILERTLDICRIMHIYKFDGRSLQKHAEFTMYGELFKYDEEGNIYYWLNETVEMELNKCFNYKTKVSNDITDSSLKKKLNQ